MSGSSFRLKGGMVPMTTLELLHFDAAAFTDQIIETVDQAPNFFQQTPVILQLDKFIPGEQTLDLLYIKTVCAKYGMILCAVRGDESYKPAARDLELAYLPAKADRSSASELPDKVERASQVTPDSEQPIVAKEPAAQAQPSPAVAENNEVRPAKIITQPVRSGQQVYAQGADLIVLAQVSEGAEVLADGNIHIYGPLRGRALAGVQGNTEARIFCQSLEAGLVSIAGQFKLSDDLKDGVWGEAAQVFLQADVLQVTAL